MHDLVFTIYSALSLLLLAASSPPHWRAGNVGAIALVSWAFVKSFGYFVNSIVWWDSMDNPIPVWCDIDIKVTAGLQVGIASATLCINRRLAIISSVKRAAVSTKDRRRSLWIDITIVVVPPVVVMIVSYCVQATRFTVQEAMGCGVATSTEVAAVLGLYVPPLLIGLISFGYGGLALYNFISRRRHFQAVMQNSSSNLNAGRFLRLIALSSTEMLLSTPFSTWVLVQNIGAIVPAQSWADVHYQFSRIYYASLTDRSWTATTFALVNFSRWIPVFTAFLYFAFFGMQEEAMSGYVSAWGAMTRAFGRLAGFLPGSPSSKSPSPYTNQPHLPNLGTSVASPSEIGWSKDLGHEEKGFGLPEEEMKDAFEPFSRSRITVTVERQVV